MEGRQIFLLFAILAIIAIVIISFLKTNNPVSKSEALCIANASLLYIKAGCVACQHQEELFGENFKYLNVIDCAITPEECNALISVPTWIINNEKYVGVKSIEELKQLTGC